MAMDPDIQFLGYGHAPEPPRRRRKVAIRTDEVIQLDSDSDEHPPPRAGKAVAGPSQPLRHPAVMGLLEAERSLSVVSSNPLYGSQATMPPTSRSVSAAPESEEDVPYDHYVAQVLEIIPDVDPGHALELLERNMEAFKDKVVESVIHVLMEDHNYPKVDRKGKGKRKREGSSPSEEGGRLSEAKVKIDYALKTREKRGGKWYDEISIDQLSLDFPIIPRAHIKRVFMRENALYVPAYLALDADQKSERPTYKPMVTARGTQGSNSKGKAPMHADEEFERERQWLMDRLQAEVEREDEALAEQLNEEEAEANGDGIECGCCFTFAPFNRMVQCPETHLFCRSCVCTYAETLLGSLDANIVCMDQSGCKAVFSESELRRIFPEKLLGLYDSVKQRKEIEAAGLENLEDCPYCDYKVVIDNPDEKLFRCENSECGAVTCRACKKPDHLPKSCQEMKDDEKLDVRHVVEEAMTAALMRNCPKCTKPFIKESGCNKMSCPNCRTLSCYVCRQIISGYEHFSEKPGQPAGQPSTSRDRTKCPLWDSVEQRHADEVAAAAKVAIQEAKRDNPEVNDKDLHVELPPAPPPPAIPAVGMGYPLPGRGAAVAYRPEVVVHRHQHHHHHQHLLAQAGMQVLPVPILPVVAGGQAQAVDAHMQLHMQAAAAAGLPAFPAQPPPPGQNQPLVQHFAFGLDGEHGFNFVFEHQHVEYLAQPGAQPVVQPQVPYVEVPRRAGRRAAAAAQRQNAAAARQVAAAARQVAAAERAAEAQRQALEAQRQMLEAQRELVAQRQAEQMRNAQLQRQAALNQVVPPPAVQIVRRPARRTRARR